MGFGKISRKTIKKVNQNQYMHNKYGKNYGRGDFKNRSYKTAMTIPKGSLNIIRNPPLTKRSKTVKQIYVDFLPLQQTPAAIGTVNSFSFTMNGPYKPDPIVTPRSHQPMGFDEQMAIYEHFTVTRSKITVNFTLAIPTAAVALAQPYVAVGLFLSPDGVNIPNYTTLMENGQVVMKTLNAQQPKATCKLAVDVSKYFNRKILNENDFRGTVTANPAEQVYVNIFQTNLQDNSQPNISWEVTIEYTISYSEPKKLNPS